MVKIIFIIQKYKIKMSTLSITVQTDITRFIANIEIAFHLVQIKWQMI